MKKLLRKFAVYLIPLPIYLGLILLIDPFNYVGISHWISEDTKESTSEKLNPQLWKMIQYKDNPCSRIILGDSRAGKIKAQSVKELTGKEYYNFAFQGGTLVDMMEAFWYANDLIKLEEVYMGINFTLYNDYERNNNVKRTKDIMRSYISYAFSKVVLTALIKNIQKQFFVRDLKIGSPGMDSDQFWKYHLKVIGKRFFMKYAHPDDFYTELSKISRYCKANDIKLVFFTPPNHTDWQHKTAEYGLHEENRIFLKEIGELGNFYNLDVPNSFTKNRKNFQDPVHPISDSMVVQCLWNEL